jgi:molybdopterin-binding protein
MDLLTVKVAAERMGVSYPTLKQWIYKKKIKVAKTAGGHYRIATAEVERMLGMKLAKPKRKSNDEVMGSLSARNKLRGTVIAVKIDGLLAQVTLNVGGQFVSGIITSEGCRELSLKPGVAAYALFKATEVMLSRN